MLKRVTNPWVVCLSAACFFFYQFIQITSFNVLKPDLTIAFNTSSAMLSLVSSLYFYGTVAFLIPAGILLDNLSTRAIILMAMGLSLIGIIIFTCATNIYVAGIGRFIVGVSGGPFCFLSTMRLASRWFPEERLAFVTGIIVSLGMCGGIVAQTPFILLVAAVGWKAAMIANLLLGVVICLILYLFVQDCPPGKEKEYLQQRAFYRTNGFVKGLKVVMLKKQNWYCGAFASLLNLPIFVFGALWGIMYVTQIYGVSALQASLICSMLFIGMIIGAPAFGFISDKLHLRKIPMFVGVVICIIAMAILIKCDNLSFFGLALVFYFMGFGSSAQILAYPTITETNPLALTGSALSLASTLIMAGGAIFQPIVGWLIESRWDGTLFGGMPLYSVENYNVALWLILACIIVSSAFAWQLRETYCRRRE